MQDRISASEAVSLVGDPAFLELREPADGPAGGEHVAFFVLPISCLGDGALRERVFLALRAAIEGQAGSKARSDGCELNLAARGLFAVQIPAAMVADGAAVDGLMDMLRKAVRRFGRCLA